MKNKKGQLELSIGTIVVLVVGVSMLILGIILVRSIMCSGLQITEDLSTGVRNEVKNLFGADKLGVKCVGQGGAEVNLGTGGKRSLVCIFKSDEAAKYTVTVDKIESLTASVSSEIANTWVLDKGWSGNVVPGQEQEEVVVLFNLPRDAPNTALKISMTATKEGGSPQSITSRVTVVPTGFIKGAIC